jgi:Rrf2 family protein
MQLPIKAHYATVAMLALAQSFESGQPLTARAIADDHEIPPQFLVQILQQLRAAGMISSTRGSSGGFRLERDPSTISLADVIEAVCPASQTSTPRSSSSLGQVAQEVWNELSLIEKQHLQELKLSELCQRAESTAESMLYIY